MRRLLLLSLAVFLTVAPHHASSQPAEPSTVQVSPLPTVVRVCLFRARKPVRIGCTGPYDYMSLGGGRVTQGSGVVTASSSGGTIRMGGKRFSGEVLIAPARSNHFVTVNGRRYRGAIILAPTGGGRFDVIEHLLLDEYLYGVLPREMGASWPMEALKAQAVVSRTYVVANLSSGGARYDVTSDVSSQVYGGVEDESEHANQAVRATRGEIIVNKEGKAVEAFFHSSCGGETETPDHVWTRHGPLEEFSNVRDPFCREDRYSNWTMEMTGPTMTQKLRRAGVRIGEIRRVKIVERSPSGRARTFRVFGTRGQVDMNGNRFRIALGPERLRSTFLTDLSARKGRFHFEGKGWGHGVGLCQWGARGRSIAGHTYDQIVQAFYPGARWVRVTTP
jgi:stage II sporulation protein D